MSKRHKGLLQYALNEYQRVLELVETAKDRSSVKEIVISNHMQHGLCYFLETTNGVAYHDTSKMLKKSRHMYRRDDYITITPTDCHFNKEDTLMSMNIRIEVIKSILNPKKNNE